MSVDAKNSGIALGYNPLHPESRELAYEQQKRLREQCPVAHSSVTDFFYVTRAEDIRAVSRNAELFSSEGTMNSGLGTDVRVLTIADDPLHRRQRSLVNMAFTVGKVAELEPFITDLVDELIDSLIEKGSCEFISEFANRIPGTVICRMLGLPMEDYDKFKTWADDGLNAIDDPERYMEKAKASMAQLSEYIRSEVRKRTPEIQRGEPRNDVLTKLIAAEIDGEVLSESELFRACWQFFAAGQETTTALIANSVYLLSEFPDQKALLLANPELVEQAIEEILRFRSPTVCLPRRCTHDTEIAGVRIPAQSKIGLMFESANRDASVWDEPDRLDITRPLNETRRKTLAFGSGVHVCLGANLARLEGRIALARLMKRMPEIEVDRSKKSEPLYHHFTHSWEKLWVKWA